MRGSSGKNLVIRCVNTIKTNVLTFHLPFPYRKANRFFHDKPRQFFLHERQAMAAHLLTQENQTCLKIGTLAIKDGQCVCKKGWHSNLCNIPTCLFLTRSMTFAEKQQLRLRRESPRRIIYGATFNHEFSMLEAILNGLYDLVDVFVLVESSYTEFGTRKPLHLLPRLHRGYLKQFHPKILYLYFDHFPIRGRKNGWIAEGYWRTFVGKQSLQHIHGIYDDDLFLVFDLDEIPTYDLLAFLKFHNGYPEPFGVVLKRTTYGFFWSEFSSTAVTTGCTIGMLRDVYKNYTHGIRSGRISIGDFPEFKVYRQSHHIRLWHAGDLNYFAGWHCTSCFDPEQIRTKFMSAQNGDFPRWGSFKEKMNLTYIARLVREGRWFDDVTRFDKAKNDSFYAPKYILNNARKYKDLLSNPYL